MLKKKKNVTHEKDQEIWDYFRGDFDIVHIDQMSFFEVEATNTARWL